MDIFYIAPSIISQSKAGVKARLKMIKSVVDQRGFPARGGSAESSIFYGGGEPLTFIRPPFLWTIPDLNPAQ